MKGTPYDPHYAIALIEMKLLKMPRLDWGSCTVYYCARCGYVVERCQCTMLNKSLRMKNKGVMN